MAHKAESYRFPYGEAQYRRKTWTGLETTVREPSGMLRSGFRSQTIMNPRDSVGWRVPSPYNANRQNAVLGFFESKGTRVNGSGGQRRTSIFQKFIPHDVNPGDLDYISADEVTQKALLKIGASKANLWVSLAERQKTVDLVTDSFRKLTSLLESVATPRGRAGLLGRLRREKRKLLKGGKEFTDSYLAYRYGVLPTMLDLQGMAAAAEEAVLDKPVHLTGRASKKIPVNSRRRTTWTPGDGIVYDVDVEGKGESGAKVRIDAVVYFQPFRTFERMGLVNLPNVGWELIPYSFVVDWFLGVGDWLQGYTALDGLEHVTVTTTRYCDVQSTSRIISPLSRDVVTWDGWHDHYDVYTQQPNVSQFIFERTVSNGSPSSKLLWKNPISLSHFADASALLVGALGKGMK